MKFRRSHRTGAISTIRGGEAWAVDASVSWPSSRLISAAGETEVVEAAVGSFDALEAADSAAFDGALVLSAALDAAESQDGAVLAGTVSDPLLAGTLGLTEAEDSATVGGLLSFSGPFAANEAAQDGFDAVGAAASAGTLLGTESNDAALVDGEAISSGSFAATESSDTSLFSMGALEESGPAEGSFAGAEAQDNASLLGEAVVDAVVVTFPSGGVYYGPSTAGVLAARERADETAISATVGASGDLWIAEADDAAEMAGAVCTILSFDDVEALDRAKGSGEVIDWTAYDNDFLLAA